MRDDWCTFLVLRLLFCMVVFLVTTLSLFQHLKPPLMYLSNEIDSPGRRHFILE